jgi:transketolase
LDNLVAIVDYNKIQSAGPTAVIQDLEPLRDKWQAFGFETREIDGHDIDALEQVLSATPLCDGKPTAVICHTVKGKGIPFAEHDPSWHHKSKLPVEVHADLYAALEDA